MRISSWCSMCLVASGLAFSTYACGDGDTDDDLGGVDAGTSSGNTSGQNGSSSSSSGSSGASSTSSGGSSSSSSGGSSSSSSSGGSSSGNVENDAGLDGSVVTDAGADAGEPTDASDGGVVVEPAGAVQYLGRWGDLNDNDDDDGPTASWPGTQVVIHFHGTGVNAMIGQVNANSGTSRYDVLVDDVLQPVAVGETAALVVANSPIAQPYTLVAGLAEADHVLRLVRRSEPQQGVNNFKSFTITGAAPKLLVPPARPARLIEVLTESTTDGFGIESPLFLGPAAGGNFEGSRVCGGDTPALYNNARRSFPYKLAQTFGAELSLLGMSAIGITGNTSGAAAFKFATFYPRINPLRSGGSGLDTAANTWSSAARPADVVLILLGGADYDANADRTSASFEADLLALVDAARARNSATTEIFLMVGPQIKDSYPAGKQQRTKLAQAMAAVRAARAADPHITVKSLPENNDQALEVACLYHANEALHTLMSTTTAPWISTATGWQP